LELKISDEGIYEFVNVDGEAMFSFDDLFMIDKENNISSNVKTSVIEIKKGLYQITIMPDQLFLESANYPVKIDPSITNITSNTMIQDKYLEGKYEDSDCGVYDDGDILNVAINDAYISRTYLNINLNAIPSNALISYSFLKYSIYCLNIDTIAVAKKVIDTKDYSDIDMIDNSFTSSEVIDYSIVSSDGGDDQQLSFDLTNYVQNQINNNHLEGAIEIRFENEENNNYLQLHSNDSSAINRPVFEIGYTETEGIRDHWTYNTQDVGRVGTGYVSDYTGYLTFIRNDISFSTELQNLSLTFAYNSLEKYTNTGYGDGWEISYNSKVGYDTTSGSYYVEDFTGYKEYFVTPTFTDDLECDINSTDYECLISIDDGKKEFRRMINIYGNTSEYQIFDPIEGVTYHYSDTFYLMSIVQKREQASLETSISIIRDPSNPDHFQLITDSSGNSFMFEYDIASGMLESVELKTSEMSSGFLEKVDYSYDSSDLLTTVSYTKDYDQLDVDNGELDYTINYTYENDCKRLISGYIIGGEKTTYTYYSPTNYKIANIKSYFNDEQLSEISYSYSNNVTTLTNHLGDYVKYVFDNFGHTVQVQDNKGNMSFYSYMNIYSVLPGEEVDYRNNHQLISKSSPHLSNDNYIQNGGFEDGFSYWNDGSNSNVVVETYKKYLGDHALWMPGDENVYQNITLDKGVYILSANIYKTSVDNEVYLEVNNNQSKKLGYSYSWQQVDMLVYIEADQTSISVKLVNDSDYSVYFDNITLTKGLSNKRINIIDNSSFEEPLENWITSDVYVTREYFDYGPNDDSDLHLYPNLGNYAIHIEGSSSDTRFISTKVNKEVIDAYNNDGWLYVGGWMNTYTAPKANKDSLFMKVSFYDGDDEIIEADEGQKTGGHVFFDQSKDSWQFNYGKIILPETYAYMMVSFVYQGIGEVLFDGATVFYDESELYYTITREVIPDGDIDETNNEERIDKIEWNDGRLIDYIYSEEDFADEPIGFIDEDGNSYEIEKDNDIVDFIVLNNVKYDTTYTDYGQVESLQVSGRDSSGGFVDYFDTSTAYTMDYQYISSQTDEFGNTTNYQTDVITGLLEYIENAKDVKTEYEYFDNGLLKKVSVDQSSINDSYVMYVYNNNDQLIEIKINHDNSTGYSYHINYDTVGRMESVEVNNQTIMSYEYVGDMDLLDESIYNGYNIYDSNGYALVIPDTNITIGEDSINLQTVNGDRNPCFGSKISVESQQTYQVYMDIISINGSVKFKVYEYSDTPGTSTYLGMQESISTNTNGEYSFEFTTDANTKYIYVTLSDSSTYTIEFSDLVLTQNADIKNQNISTQTYGNGDKIYFSYSDDGLLDKISYQNFQGYIEDRFSYLYDESGKLAIYNDLVNEYTEYYEYDDRGNLTCISNSYNDEINYSYDSKGQLNSILYDIDSVDSETFYNYYGEFSDGLYDFTTFDNGGKEIAKNYKYEENGINRLLTIDYTWKNSSSQDVDIFDIKLTYDDIDVILNDEKSNRVDKIEYIFNENSDNGVSYSYSFDELGNIICEVYINKSEDIDISKSYVYDDMNRLVQEHSRDSQYSVSSTYATTNYTKYYHYDKNGNITAINTFGYGLSEEIEPEIPSFSLLNRGKYIAHMFYNGSNGYQNIYHLQVGQTPNINFTFYDHWDTSHQWPLNLTVTELVTNIDTSNEGYYYNYYKATDGLNYEVRFRIVFRVGTPAPVLRERENYINYDYNSIWLDQLESYTIDNDTSNITYDDSGNPINITNFKYEDTLYNRAVLDWEGRKLTYLKVYKYSGSSPSDKEIWYTYNDQGIRIQKVLEDSSGIIKYDYKLSGDLVVLEVVSEYNDSTQTYDGLYKIAYSYDYDGTPIGFTYIDDSETTDYIYVKNLMGDITHIIDLYDNIVVEYTYDAYGNITQLEGTKASTIGKYNSLRYRSYMYDSEISMYYLNSRFYNPEVGRFINADGLLGEVGNLQTHNMYTYCANNPVMLTDSTGYLPQWFENTLAIGGAVLLVAGIAVAAGLTGGLAGAALMAVAFSTGIGAYRGVSTAIEDGTSIAAGVLSGGIKGLATGTAIGLGIMTGGGAFSALGGLTAFGGSLAINFGAGIGSNAIYSKMNDRDFSRSNAINNGFKQMASGAFAFAAGGLIGASGLYNIPGQTKLLSSQWFGNTASGLLFKAVYYYGIDAVIWMM